MKCDVLNRIIVLLALAAGVSYGGIAIAGEGRIPIASSTLIDQPGHYVVVRDIEVSGGDVITISASDVILDLGGHTLTRNGSTGRPLLLLADTTNITIRNGRLEGGESGVERYITGVRATIRLEDLDITGAAQFGIQLLELDYVESLRCRVTGDLAYNGVSLSGGTGAFSGRIVGNVVENAQGFGIIVKGLKGGDVRDNQVFNTAGGGSADGLNLWSEPGWGAGGNLVSGNTVRDSGGVGITVASTVPGNSVFGNTATDNTADGIHIFSEGNLLEQNIASGNNGNGFGISNSYNQLRTNHAVGNTGDGLHVGGLYNLIDNNTSEGNTGYGLYFTGNGANAYRSNMLRGNTAGALVGLANTDAGGNIQ